MYSVQSDYSMKTLLSAIIAAICCLVTSCSKTPADSITDVLNECAEVGRKSGKYSDPAAQANFVAKSFQEIDVTDCPADFRMAYQDHVNAWQNSVSALANNTGGTAFIEGLPSPEAGGRPSPFG